MNSITTNNTSSLKKAAIPRFDFLLEFSFLIFALTILMVFSGNRDLQTLSLIFTSIILEAFPFMLFGSVVGGLVEIFISRERMTTLLPKKHPWLAIFIAGGLGFIFPVCECAVVPVVRRLIRKGLPVGAAIAYLLGGPIVNPIVAASTALAYKFNSFIVLSRLGWGYLIAVTIGLLMSRLFTANRILKKDMQQASEPPCQCGTVHSPVTQDNAPPSPGMASFTIPMYQENKHDDSCGCGHHHDTASFKGKIASALCHAADDFMAVGHFLVIGAFIAALAQTFIDRKIFLDFAGYPGLPSMLMMTLAILLNLCSEADAFIAASFRGLMPVPAQLAFLLTGPMFDLKLLLMYQNLFRKRAIVALSSLILILVLAVALFLEFTMGGGLQ